jgi:hypothetical protein
LEPEAAGRLADDPAEQVLGVRDAVLQRGVVYPQGGRRGAEADRVGDLGGEAQRDPPMIIPPPWVK